jgi:hypothetical protein
MCIPSIKTANKDRFLEALSKTVRTNNVTFITGVANQNMLAFDFSYGPVAGGWRSDVTAKVKAALKKAGSHASPQYDRCKRTAFPRFV